ncbi:hypothetical protein SGP14015_42620 [Shigella flexneri]|nr:hypothetical protein SGP14015_42620 [Shigella flexneri]
MLTFVQMGNVIIFSGNEVSRLLETSSANSSCGNLDNLRS